MQTQILVCPTFIFPKIPLRIYGLNWIIFSMENVEKFRWPTTMGLLGVFSLFCILLFIGAIVHSRATLIIFSVCGLFSIILLWLMASIYVTMAVAMADFCNNPNPGVKLALTHYFNLTEDVSNHYLTCKKPEMGPFQKPLQVSSKILEPGNKALDRGAELKLLNYLNTLFHVKNHFDSPDL